MSTDNGSTKPKEIIGKMNAVDRFWISQMEPHLPLLKEMLMESEASPCSENSKYLRTIINSVETGDLSQLIILFQTLSRLQSIEEQE